MKKLFALFSLGIFLGSGVCASGLTVDEIEYWGVVVVGLAESQHPYIYDALLQSSRWNVDHLRLLWKENATRAAIFSALDWLASNADENDIVLFSVDIHGTYGNGSYGIWPWDGYENGMITVGELDEKCDAITAKGLCLVLDCCLAGSFVNPDQTVRYRSTLRRTRFYQTVSEGLEGANRVIIMGTLPKGLGMHFVDYDFKTGEIISDTSPSSTFAEALATMYDENHDEITSAEECFSYLKTHYRKYALRGFFSIFLQIYYLLRMGFILKPFPTLYDSFDGELPLLP